MMKVPIVKCHNNAIIPTRATPCSAGFDLYACLDNDEIILSQKTGIIKTGVSIAIPEGFVGLVCPRSGLAAKFEITVLNAPGVIDSDYRGEIMCILKNLSTKDFVVIDGMRIAQLVVVKHESVSFVEVDNHLSQTIRDVNGFGSTGL